LAFAWLIFFSELFIGALTQVPTSTAATTTATIDFYNKQF